MTLLCFRPDGMDENDNSACRKPSDQRPSDSFSQTVKTLFSSLPLFCRYACSG